MIVDFFRWIGEHPGNFVIALDLLAFLGIQANKPDINRVGHSGVLLWILAIVVPIVIGWFCSFAVLGLFFDMEPLLHTGISLAFGISIVYFMRPWNWF